MTGNGTRPTAAMVLAAGRGERLRPITDSRPKPLVEVAGATLLDRALDHLAAEGVRRVVVNAHYKGEMIAEHLAGRPAPEIVLSAEKELLDTGGGVTRALPHLGEAPFFAVNGDSLWLNGRRRALERLAAAWDDARMDALLMVFSTARAVGFAGLGDFMMDQEGRLARRPEARVAPFAYMGLQILHPRLFRDAPAGAFSLNLLWDRAAEAGRLFGLAHDGLWYHISTPADLERTDALLLREGFTPNLLYA